MNAASCADAVRLYPCRDQAVRDLVAAMAFPHHYDVLAWVSRETRAASPAEVALLVDAAGDLLLESSSEDERETVLRTIDAARTTVSRYTALRPTRSEDAADAIVDSLVAIVRVSDAVLADHLDAVGALAGRLAGAMRFDPSRVRDCVRIGRLHDVGRTIRICVPGDSRGEASARVLAGLPPLARYAAFVRSHEERADGSGIPDGLAGEAIPAESRVVAVADVLHSLMSEVPERAAVSGRTAVEALAAARGSSFDPLVVDALVGLFPPLRRAVSAA